MATTNANSSKWASRFPVYQIDFTAVASGKRVATSKRRMRWRFGFSNLEALEMGQTGTSCRGEEHDITVIWSVTSGKRLVLADGQEVHYSTVRSGLFEFSWTMRGNHVLKVICNAAPQISGNPNFRQYDLMVDGQSFFVMPKVYELGIRGPISHHAPVPGVVSHQHQDSRPPPPSTKQEEEELQRAIQESLQESHNHLMQKSSDNANRAEGNVAVGDSRDEYLPSYQPAPEVPSTAIPLAAEPTKEMDLLDLMGGMTVGGPSTQFLSSDGFATHEQAKPSQPVVPSLSDPFAPHPPMSNSYFNYQNVTSPTAVTQQHMYQAPQQHNTMAPAPSPQNNYAVTSSSLQQSQQPNLLVPTSNTPASASYNAKVENAHTSVRTSAESKAASRYQDSAQVPAITPVDASSMMNKLVNFDNLAGSNRNLMTGVFGDAQGQGSGSAGLQPSLSEMKSSKPAGSKQEIMKVVPDPTNTSIVSHGQQQVQGNYQQYQQPGAYQYSNYNYGAQQPYQGYNYPQHGAGQPQAQHPYYSQQVYSNYQIPQSQAQYQESQPQQPPPS